MKDVLLSVMKWIYEWMEYDNVCIEERGVELNDNDITEYGHGDDEID